MSAWSVRWVWGRKSVRGRWDGAWDDGSGGANEEYEFAETAVASDGVIVLAVSVVADE